MNYEERIIDDSRMNYESGKRRKTAAIESLANPLDSAGTMNPPDYSSYAVDSKFGSLFFAFCIPMFVLFFCSTFALGQTGTLQGRVTGDKEPIPGATVVVIDTKFGTTSDLQGYYTIQLPIGEYEIRISAIGFRSEEIIIEIEANKETVLDIQLLSEALTLNAVEITAKDERDASDTKTSLISLSPESAKILPGAVEDVMRTLQSLPGVLAPNDFSSQLVVRGSGPDQNLIVMDDIEIFNPYRLYGVVSMFNPDAVSDIELVTGGFPARYGDRLSAVLDVKNREGDETRSIGGSLNASIVSANLILEGKNPFDVKGSYLFSTRRTYYDLILAPFAKSAGLVDDNVTFPNFYDAQLKLALGPFNGHRVLITGIYSADGVDVVSGKERNTPDSISMDNITRNDVLGVSWQYASSKRLMNKLTLSWYRNKGTTGFDSEVLDPSLNRNKFDSFLPDTLSPYLLSFSFNAVFDFTKYSVQDRITYLWGEHVFEAGLGMDILETTLRFDFELDPQLEAIFAANPNFRSAAKDLSDVKTYRRYNAYAQNTFRVTDWMYMTPGVRFDNFEILGKSYLAPRLAFSFELDPITTLRAVWGIYYQSPGYEKLRDRGVIFDFSSENVATLQPEQSIHYVLGFERWLDNEWNFRIEGYYKDFRDLIIPKELSGTKFYTEQIPGRNPHTVDGWTRPVRIPTDSLTQIPVNTAYGEAYGFELLLAKKNRSKDSKWSGWVSYSLAWADRFENNAKIPFRFDQRHTINIVLDYQMNKEWSFGIRWQYGSGFPFTEPVGVKPRVLLVDTNGDLIPDTPQIAVRRRAQDPSQTEVIYDIDFGDRTKYNARKPEYHRLDLRVNYSTTLWNLPWNFYLDVINIYNRSNVISYNYYVNDDLTIGAEKTTMFPILPTIGFSVLF